MKKVTIQEMANQLGLSRNTVAKAINGGNVSYETKMMIVKKAYDLGYSKLDKNLITQLKSGIQEQNTGTILVLFNRDESYFWNRILTGISDELNKKTYRMQLHIVDEKDIESGEETLKLVVEDVKAIIFLCKFPLTFATTLSKANVPMTFFNAPMEASGFLKLGDIVTLEGLDAMYQMVQKAIAKDKKTFGFIGCIKESMDVFNRYLGFMEALKQNGIEVNTDYIFTEKAQYNYYNYQVIEDLIIKLKQIPEVFVCANDDIAKHVANAIAKIDLNLAQNITLIGFDNTIEKEFFKSDIYTVNIRKEAVGRRLVKSVFDQMEDDNDHAIITLATYPLL